MIIVIPKAKCSLKLILQFNDNCKKIQIKAKKLKKI